MPVPLGAKKHVCTKCRYSKIIYHRTDMILTFACPKCGGEMVLTNESNLLVRILNIFFKK